MIGIIVEENKLLLSDPSSSSMTMMKQLADNDPDSLIDINGEQLLDRTKLFVVAYARSQLNRIIKLTNFTKISIISLGVLKTFTNNLL